MDSTPLMATDQADRIYGRKQLMCARGLNIRDTGSKIDHSDVSKLGANEDRPGIASIVMAISNEQFTASGCSKYHYVVVLANASMSTSYQTSPSAF